MYDIITTGSATVDVFANTHSQLIKFVTNDDEDDYIAYPSGSKILIKELQFLIGGGGTNTAVSFSRLGLKTAYLGKIGTDTNSTRVLNLLEEEDVDFIGVQEGQTGYSIVLDSIEHDRTILTFKGANDNLQTKDVRMGSFDSRWFYSSSLTGESLNTLKELVNLAHRTHTRIAFNPSNYQAKQGYEALKDIVEKCTVLVMNKEEADLLFHKAINPTLFNWFIQEHANMYLVITDGAKGAVCYHDGEQCYITPNPHSIVVETTGAGDAFASGFVAGLAGNMNLADALKLGMIQSESVIGCVGAKEKLLIKEVAHQRLSQFQGEITYQKKPSAKVTSPIAPHHELPEFYEAPEEKGFTFNNGHLITSLEELGYYLKFIDDEQYQAHVGDGYNHFADWIQHVFLLDLLAEELRQTQGKEQQSEKIIRFVHEGGRE